MRVKSGINGFDELAEGGFPDRTVILLSGPAGSAKSLFGMQFVHRGAMDYMDVGIYLTLEESRDNVLRAANAYGMDLQPLEKEGKIHLLDFGEIRAGIDMDEELDLGVVSFMNLKNFLTKLIQNTGARRLVVDSISAIGLYYRNQDEFRRELFAFCRFLKDQEITSLLITEAIETLGSRFDVEQFVADSIISLLAEFRA